MGLTNCILGHYLELCSNKNTDLVYGIYDVRGVNNLKQLMPTKADLNGRDLSKFQIVNSGEFVFNHRTSRNGSKFSIAYNDNADSIICTEDYVVFKVRDDCKEILNTRWLYMFFNRPEFDRYVITNSWGSSTEFYNWEDIKSIEIELPLFSIQQKYAKVYNAMLENQKSYERGLDDLKLSFEALIDEYKHKAKKKNIGSILQEVDCRNANGSITNVQGINITKQFMPSVANTNDVDISKYKVVKKGQFVFSGMQTGRDECIRIALFDKNEPIIISPAYAVLEVIDDNILAEYVMMWFSRKEVDRLGWFMSDGSIRTNLDMDRFYEIEIPVPDLDVQKLIVEIYNVYNVRRDINEKLKSQINDICPILIKGSIEEAKKTKEA
ncbi:restriction endonuclease subunit S [Parablautia intestinalis]|uniref:Restriction endonuclease subunit S n=1 Tax=Parablautia intestinalis TaxID=2320100 RepID=A0A3A9AHN5_9FIRM|nr:restriction endonuclease subunit S [Parablautia intestinalis]RKI86881.1 restriction endonuclease subunit S [Parablautia intestinalis]